jgi:hypothetical protein
MRPSPAAVRREMPASRPFQLCCFGLRLCAADGLFLDGSRYRYPILARKLFLEVYVLHVFDRMS